MKQETGKLLQKAARAIRAAETLLNDGDVEFAAGRAYYAMFYAASALLDERNLGFAKHGGVHAAFGREFAKTNLLDPKFHRWLIAAFGKRVQGDYGIDAVLTPEEVGRMIEQAREFLEEARRFLGAPSSGPGPATP